MTPKAKSAKKGAVTPAKEITLTAVGFHFRLVPHQIEKLQQEIPIVLELRREPENEYDMNAIAIWGRERPFVMKLGYISKPQAAEIAPRMDAEEFEISEAWLLDLAPATHDSIGGNGYYGEVLVKL
jgi:hypothetical protein